MLHAAMSPLPDTHAVLFNAEALDAAQRQGEASRFRWLALSEDPEAVALRAGLQHCFACAGAGAATLRKGLMHERWGQHAGALGHLLALGMLVRQGWSVSSEPALAGQSPDILASRPGMVPADASAVAVGAPAALRALIEVRAVTGAGTFPWEARREARALSRGAQAQARAEAEGRVEALRESVAAVLARKAETYAPLAAHLALPLVICLYEDLDDVIAEVVRAIAFGRGGDPRGGAFAGPSGARDDGLRAVAAVLVFGRVDTDDGALLLRGHVLHNPSALRPLPGGPGDSAAASPFPLLRRLRLEALPGRTPKLEWEGRGPVPFALTPSGTPPPRA
jgi:hypothetical protein